VGGDEVISSAVVPPECDRRIRALYDYWCGIHPTEAILPGRQHVEPLDLAEVPRWLWLVDVQREPLRFRYRLVGTGHRDVMGADLTGRWLDEAFPGFARLRGHADHVAVAGGEIRYCRRVPDFSVEKGLVRMDQVMLPLARDGVTVDMLLGLSLFTRNDGSVV
jgi:PAS domain-containing protein